MDFLQQYGFDDDKENNGVWCDLPDAPGIQLLVGRFQSEPFQMEMLTVREKHLADIKKAGENTPEQKALQRKLMIEVMAKTVLLGWRGDVNYGGKPLAYSFENAVMLLEHRSFREQVLAMSVNEQNYRVEIEAEEEKNSLQLSAGSTSGAPT